MTINQTHIDWALNGKTLDDGTRDLDHKIDKQILQQIPKAIEDPVAVIESQSHNETSVVAILKFMSSNGKQVIAAIHIDGFARQNGIRINSNDVKSIHGRNNTVTKLLYEALLKEEAGDIGVYWINKNEATILLQRAGLQLPGGLPRPGLVHSIREDGASVNIKLNNVTESLQFKSWFGDWKRSPKKASKVINEDGTPKIVYHSTGTEFQ